VTPPFAGVWLASNESRVLILICGHVRTCCNLSTRQTWYTMDTYEVIRGRSNSAILNDLQWFWRSSPPLDNFLNRRPICVKTYKENAFTEELYSVSCTLAYNFSVRYTANLGHRESLVRTINNCNMKTATLLLQSTNRKSSCPIKQRRFRCILFSSWFNCRRDRGSTVSIV